MSVIKRNVISNANVYLAGTGLLGQVEEVNMPEIKFKKSDYKALGLFAMFDFTSGIEKMENKIKWSSFYEDTLKKIANPFGSLSLQIRGSLQNWEATSLTGEQQVTAYLRANTTNFPGAAFKQGDPAEMESTFSVTYYKLEIADIPVIEVDAPGNIFKVDGVDLLAAFRANLGA